MSEYKSRPRFTIIPQDKVDPIFEGLDSFAQNILSALLACVP